MLVISSQAQREPAEFDTLGAGYAVFAYFKEESNFKELIVEKGQYCAH